jgi:nuclear GTP-binding protein
VSVGSTPGLTRTAQQIQLDKNIALYDCPGIIFTSSSSQAEAALRNAVRIEQIADPVGPVELVLQKCTKELLASVYKIAMFSSTAEFLTNVAQKRGKLQRGGAVSLEGAARLILKDWTEGKIPYLSTPPARQNGTVEVAANVMTFLTYCFSEVHVEASVVPDWGKYFNIQEIERLEAEHVFSNLSAVDGSDFIQIASEVAAPDGTYANISAPLQAIAYSYSESDSDEEESGEDVDMEEDGEESGDDDAMVDTVPAEPEVRLSYHLSTFRGIVRPGCNCLDAKIFFKILIIIFFFCFPLFNLYLLTKLVRTSVSVDIGSIENCQAKARHYR